MHDANLSIVWNIAAWRVSRGPIQANASYLHQRRTKGIVQLSASSERVTLEWNLVCTLEMRVLSGGQVTFQALTGISYGYGEFQSPWEVPSERVQTQSAGTGRSDQRRMGDAC